MQIEADGKIDISGFGTEGAYIKSKGSIRLDIDNDNDHTDRAFIVSSNNASSDILTITETGAATFAGKIITTELESASTILLDAATDITLDAGGADIILSDDETIFGTISSGGGNHLQIRSRINDADMFLRGVDNNVEFNALQLDMSAAGKAIFNAGASFGGEIDVQSSTHSTLRVNSGNSDNVLFLQAIQSDNARIGTSTNTDLSFFTNGSEKIRIKNTGLVGINATSPNTQFEVRGAATTGSVGTASVARFGRPTSVGTSFDQYVDFKIGRHTAPGGAFQSFTRFDIDLRDDSTTTGNNTNIMTLLNDGRVGIGQVAPNSGVKLEVNGLISANGDNAPTGGGVVIGDYQSGGYKFIQSFESQPLRINPLGNNVLIPASSLGVGTTSPQSDVHIVGVSNDTVSQANANLNVEGQGGNGMVVGTIASAPYSTYIQSGFVDNFSTAVYPLVLNPLGGSVEIGFADQTEGKLKINGQTTGLPEGGQIELHTAADYDSTYAFYRIDAYEDDLRIGRQGTTDWQLNSSGYVGAANRLGVGTLNPNNILQVVGNITIGTGATNEAVRTLLTGGTLALQATDANHRIIIRGTQSTDGTITGNSNNMDFYEFGGYNFYTGVNTGTGARVLALSMSSTGAATFAGRVIIGDDAITTDKPGLVVGDTTNGGQITIRGLSPTLAFDKTGSNNPKILTDGSLLEIKSGTLDSEGSVLMSLTGSAGNATFAGTISSKDISIKQGDDSSFDGGLTIERSANTQKVHIGMDGGAVNFNSPDGLSYKFRNNGTEKFSVDGSGNGTFAGDVQIGSSGTANLYLGNTIGASSSNRGMRLHTNNSDAFFDFQGVTDDSLFFRDYDGSGGIHTRHQFVISNGNIVAAGTVTQNGSPSDIKYKENIKTISNGIDKIEKLNPVEFDWNDKSDAHKIGKKEDAGFIAQEVQKVLPNLVNENVDGDLALNYEGIIPYLVQSIQDLKKEIEILKNK